MGGLEVDHPDHDERQRAHYRALAARLDLVPTGASDCHGARYGYRLGCETTPVELVDELLAASRSLMRLVRVADRHDPRLRDFLDLRDTQMRAAQRACGGVLPRRGRGDDPPSARCGVRAAGGRSTTERWLRGARRSRHDRLRGARRRARGDDRVPGASRRAWRASRGGRCPRSPIVLAPARIGSSSWRIWSTTPTSGPSCGRPPRFGWDAVLLTPRCADPLYRRAVRTSMGAVFALPWTRIDHRVGIEKLHDAGFTVAALTPAADAIALDAVERGPRVALVVGSEGPGLSDPVARRRRSARADPDARRGRFAERRRGRGGRAVRAGRGR